MTNPPNNPQAEQAILGAILFENQTLWRVRDLISPADFYIPDNARLFETLNDLIPAGELCDGVTLRDRFDGFWLEDLLDACPDGQEAEDYAHVVADLALRRKLIEAAHGLQARAGAGPGREALDDHASTLEALHGRASGMMEVFAASDRPEDIFAESDTACLIPTGMPELDRSLRGFERGALSIVAARPGVGKSAFAVCVGANVAQHSSVGFVSCDMQGEEVRRRLACYLNLKAGKYTPIVSDLKNPGMLNAELRANLVDALSRQEARQFFINDRHGQTVGDVSAQIRAWKRHCARKGLAPLGMVFVDHIAKIAPRQRWNSLYEKTSFACNELLDVAKQHPDVAIVALCQLNRETEKAMAWPGIHHLRDSGKIEEDATAILLLHREDHYWEDRRDNETLDEDERREAQLKLLRCKGQFGVAIGKNRNGRKQTITLQHVIEKNLIRDRNAAIGREEAA